MQRRRAAGLPGPAAPDREVLRRQVRVAAAGAHSLPDFLERLRADGLLVRERLSAVHPGEVTGYAVALPDRYDSGVPPVFYGGGKLAPDLTVPRLQRRWQHPATHDGRRTAAGRSAGRAHVLKGTGPGDANRSRSQPERPDQFGLTPSERWHIWEQARLAAADATEQITASAATDPLAAADAAWAASDFLAAAGRIVDGRHGGPLSAAAERFDESARELFGAAPTATAAGHGLRAAGRLLLTVRVAKPSETRHLMALLHQLVALSDAVSRLREAQRRAAQAAAARAAAEQLRAVTSRYDRHRIPTEGRTAAATTVPRANVIGAMPAATPPPRQRSAPRRGGRG